MTEKHIGVTHGHERDPSGSTSTGRLQQLRSIKQSIGRIAERLPRKVRIRFSASLVAATLEAYWTEVQVQYAERRPLRPPFEDMVVPPLDESSGWLARRLGEAAANVDPVTAGYFIGTTYAAAIPNELRAQWGVYYTPPAIAARLLDQAEAAGVHWNACSVLDPACGGSAFLAPVAERITKALSHLEPSALLHELAARIRGFEIDPVAAWMSQVLLEATVLPLCQAARRDFPIAIEVRNTLTHEGVHETFNLVIGNPPYGRVSLAPRVRARYAETLYGHANLYGLFTSAAMRFVKPGGVVAFVTPTSFLAGEYFKNLRRLLGSAAPPKTIDFIAERKGVFDEVLQETVLATYRKRDDTLDTDAGSAAVSFVAPVDETMVRVKPVGSFVGPTDPSSPWLVPRDPLQDALIKRLRDMPSRLVDWGYEVSTGPLVWNRHKDQLRPRHGHGCLPLIWAECVRSDGGFELRAMKPNHRQFFKILPGDDWLVIRQSCVLVQRTTSREQFRRLIAAVLPTTVVRDYGGAVVENHLNMIRPITASPAVAPRVVAAFLNTEIADRVFRCLSGSVAVSAYELRAMPLPSAHALGAFHAAVRRNAARDVRDRIGARLYGGGAAV